MTGINMLLVIGAMMLLATLSLTFQQSNAHQMTDTYFNEAVIYATFFAQSMMDEIQSRAFDEKTIGKSVVVADSLSLFLGHEAGESPNKFDDVDDYRGHVRTDTLSRLGTFTGRVRVVYVETMNPDQERFVPTFSKKVELFVRNHYLPDSLSFRHVISY
jgi:hypothetical protein